MLISISEINCPMSQALTWSEMKLETPLFCSAMKLREHGDEALVDLSRAIRHRRRAPRRLPRTCAPGAAAAPGVSPAALRSMNARAFDQMFRARSPSSGPRQQIALQSVDAIGIGCDRCRAGPRTTAPCGRTRRGTDASDPLLTSSKNDVAEATILFTRNLSAR